MSSGWAHGRELCPEWYSFNLGVELFLSTCMSPFCDYYEYKLHSIRHSQIRDWLKIGMTSQKPWQSSDEPETYAVKKTEVTRSLWWISAWTENPAKGSTSCSTATVTRRETQSCLATGSSCEGPAPPPHPLHIKGVKPLSHYRPAQDCCSPNLTGQLWKYHSFQTTGLLDAPSSSFFLSFLFFLHLFTHSFFLCQL